MTDNSTHSADTHPAIGIDLGTTFSVVAQLDETGRPQTITNSEGDLTTPSIVFFDGSEVIVGKEAVKAAPVEPEQIAQFAKRDMGNEFYSKTINGEQLPPEVVQSFILQKLKRDAELKLGPINKAVVTVPAFFNEPRRKATQDAGALAGLEILDIINEPTAAAIAYGVQSGFLNENGESTKKETVLVYDLGGGTFDVTLMQIDGRQYQAIATAGDVYLGGIDWDRRIVDYIAGKYLEKHPDNDPRRHATGLQRLLREAEDTKRTLSTREATSITFEHRGEAVRVKMTREEFESMTNDLLERTRFTTRHVLTEGKMTWADVTRILLVGGSSRMPQVHRMLEEEWGQPVDRSLSADEAVAHGAAVYAGLLLKQERGETPESTVTNVNSHDLAVLGIEQATGRPRASVMIPRNTPLPVKKGRRYSTAKADQRTVVVKVIEGGDASGNNSTPIGKCIVRNLPPNLPAKTPVDVFFNYAANGRLSIKAALPDQKIEATLEIKRATGMDQSAIQKWKRRLASESGPLQID